MAFFALLWKARTIEKYRLNYEKEKINSIVLGHTEMEQTLSQRWRHYRLDTKKRISRTFNKWYPEGSGVANFFLYLRTDQTFPNFLLKSVMGFVGGIILTYLCFMFFVFQLSISLIHATIMSSIIGVLLTLGLAFSYRIRCLVFLLIPQFFSRVGRYTLTCYALVLILTGPATNTLKNSEVLSESMACSQEQIKTSVHQLNDLMKKPFNAMKDSIKLMVDRMKMITAKLKEAVVRLDRLVLSIVNVIQSSFSWLQSVADICNAKLGTPYDRCNGVMAGGVSDCKNTLGSELSMLCNVAYVAQAACHTVKPFKAFCYASDFMDEAILTSVKKKLRNFTEYLRAMFHVEVHMHHSYSFSSNTSRSASQVAAGIVTEIRNRADPLLTWLSWSSCVTSLFLLLIIFRAKYYQHMYETRSRFDNRYVTKELQELDLKRQRQGRETVLPLNRREQAKYITTTSFRLVASEKVYLNRSAVFMAITTFKLLIHMVADYSLYWVLMTIRYHGRYQSDLMPGIPYSGVHVSGSGFVARLFRSIVGILDIPLSFPAASPKSCLPDPYPPDLRRYTQIGVLIFLLWFFALFEPYGLRLRHLIMGHYRPERAKARATWLFNHILRTRASFMKFARRKLHREYKYTSEASLTFRQWITDHTPCDTPNCPGVFCISCFTDIGKLCTICLSPADYGDLSDVSFETGSSDDDDNDGSICEDNAAFNLTDESNDSSKTENSGSNRWNFFTKTGLTGQLDTLALVPTNNYERDFTHSLMKHFRNMSSNMKIRCWDKKYTLEWVAKLTSENMYKDLSTEENFNFYSNSLDFEQYGEFDEVFNRTKSIGINTDRNRGVLLNMLVNSFTRRKIKRPHNKQQKTKLDHKQSREPRPEQHRNLKTICEIIKYNVVETNKNSTKTIHAHNLAIRQRNLKNILRSKKDNRTKDKIKVYEELKSIIKAIRYFLRSNEIVNMTNQNNDTEQNSPPIDNSKDITKPSDKAQPEGNKKGKNKKKTPKGNKPKRSRKLKDINKLKTKNSRHRISEFHTFFSNHWNNFKYSIMSCTGAQNKLDTPLSKEKRNHKRRKKRKGRIDLNETDIEECFVRKDIKHTRNLRISAFLAELEWIKRDYKKDKDWEGNDSFLFTEGPPVPINTNKIVGMVQLKNLPFQWREAPKNDICHCHNKRCSCQASDKYLKLFGPLSKHKAFPKKALERFRTKVNTVKTPPCSLMQKMMSTINATSDNSTLNHESSICISKRTSLYQAFTKELTQNAKILDTNMLFKNDNFMDDLAPDASKELGNTSKLSMSNTLFKGLIVSRSSKEKDKPRITKHCKCDVYDDLQRKWTHVKKSVSDNVVKLPLSMLKNFCSSLFGPSCTTDTCPNKPTQKANDKKKKVKIAKNLKKYKGPTSTQTDKVKSSGLGVQTELQKDTETQLEDEFEDKQLESDKRGQFVEECQLDERGEDERAGGREWEPAMGNSSCEGEMNKLRECLKRNENDRMAGTIVENRSGQFNDKATKGIYAKPETSSGSCQAAGGRNCNNQSPQFDKRETKHAKPKASRSKGVGSVSCGCVNKGIHAKPEMTSGAYPSKECIDCCNRSTQFDKHDAKNTKSKGAKNKGVGSVSCACESKGTHAKPEMTSGAYRTNNCDDCCNRSTQFDKHAAKDARSKNARHKAVGGAISCECAHKGIDVNPTMMSGPYRTADFHDCCNHSTQFDKFDAKDAKNEGVGSVTCAYVNKGIDAKPEMTSGTCQAAECFNCSNRSAQFDKYDAKETKCKAVGSVTYACDQGVQSVRSVHGTPRDLCTCATQHTHSEKHEHRTAKPLMGSIYTGVEAPNYVNKKTQLGYWSHKDAHSTARKNIYIKKDAKTNPMRNHKLSLENSMCVLTDSTIGFEAMQTRLTDTVTDTSQSSVSLEVSHSEDETKTDTTVCSLATVDYNDTPRRRTFRVKVVTKTNQATLTDKTRLRDTGTVTRDWWSPIVERKANDEILLEKKKGFNAIEKQKRELRQLKEWKELREVRKRRRNCGVTTDGRNVTFRSRTQIIPTGLFRGANDIMSPSRYLLESQKYYNELFSYNFHLPLVDHQKPKYQEKEKIRSPMGSRRNHHRKTKRLEECYSPRRQLSPMMRYTDSTRTSDSPRRRSYSIRHSNYRHYPKFHSPRKRV